ncbi:PREDICTED: uncharacterized protein LOC105312497 [Amphimedon queenslandica]|uniref:Rho-GAP domain-containing protein n=1 Tax=Amphimedon queenslandica TaxID=400682 RepID=A0A1X7VV30_AMPQE|nr:PREDICTED: uncharacterized protein LOC105312497 [Amphimedon queenslandica]|eukprot:XP_019851096.1 PREDICTED: uncharacterized protein LOC105312497 [Amphimedon queenslandica]
MAASGKAVRGSLVDMFDDIVTGAEILSKGTEKAFADYLTHSIDLVSHEVERLKKENSKLKKDNEAKDIKLKLSRKSLEDQMNECILLKSQVKENERQRNILISLLTDDKSIDKAATHNEVERLGLALLKRNSQGASPGGFLSESGECPTFSEASVNMTDATDIDDDDDSCKAATWKRRRTASVEWALESSCSKRRRPVDFLDDKENTDREFKKPTPNKSKRKPSHGHLHMMKQQSQPTPTPPETSPPKTPPITVPPLNLPQLGDESPVPSAPSEHEVALVNQGLLSPHSPSPHPSPHPYSPQLPGGSPCYEADPLALTPPLSSATNRLYPNLIEGGGDEAGFYEGQFGATPLYQEVNYGMGSRSSSHINLHRKHSFLSKTIMKSESCQVCKKKVGFGKSCSKCKDCRALCHTECKEKLPLPCVPTVHTPKKKQKESGLSAYCPHTVPRVPSLIVHCVNEIESRGMNQVGLYRVSGSDRSAKELKERLLAARGTPNFDKVADVNVICGCLKQFLLQLNEPLVTNELRSSFLNAIDNEEMALHNLLISIAALPSCNKHTLAFIILHLQKIASNSKANKMTVECLSRVFAPTIVGASLSAESLFADIQKQQKVVERLLKISHDYWSEVLSCDDNPALQSPTPSQVTLPSPTTPCIINSPSTPDLLPIPQSPFLGPCQSPQGGRIPPRTPVITRSMSNSSVTRSVKKGSTFFGAIN